MFHPSMLANQPELRTSIEGTAYHAWKAGYSRAMVEERILRPNGRTWSNLLTWMSAQGLGTIPETQAAPAFGFDAASGVLNVGGNQIKLVPAILSAIAVKLVFFSGKQVAKGARYAAGRLRTNPDGSERRLSEKPYECVLFNADWKRIGRKRTRTRAAAEAFAAAHPGANHRISYIG